MKERAHPLTVYIDQLYVQLVASIVSALKVHFASGSCNTEFMRGYLTHAQTMTLSVGLDWPSVYAECQAQLGVDFDDLLFQNLTLEGGLHGSGN